jgi:hypothetical protein
MTYTYTRSAFDCEYEEYVRNLTHPNGRGNAAYDPCAERKMLPQDRLLEAEITMGKTTGVAIEFRWASGRKDVWCVLDLPVESVGPEVIENRTRYIEQLKERNHAEKAAA